MNVLAVAALVATLFGAVRLQAAAVALFAAWGGLQAADAGLLGAAMVAALKTGWLRMPGFQRPDPVGAMLGVGAAGLALAVLHGNEPAGPGLACILAAAVLAARAADPMRGLLLLEGGVVLVLCAVPGLPMRPLLVAASAGLLLAAYPNLPRRGERA